MSGQGLLHRCARGGVLAIAAFGAAAHLLLLLHLPVPDLLLPACLLLGAGAGSRANAPAPVAPRWLPPVALLALAAAGVALGIGSLGTPTRHWDGAVAWEPKARWLAAMPTLEQPFFRDPTVFCHSRDYPLLQPLLLGMTDRLFGDGIGRAWFVALYALLLALGGSALWRTATSGGTRWLALLALGITPALVGPTSSAADSGYAEVLLLVTTTAMAAGLLTDDRLLLAGGALLAVIAKPEGLFCAAMPAVVLWCRGGCGLSAAAGGCTLGMLLWLPLQRDLVRFGERPPAWLFAAPVLLLALVLGADAALARRAAGRRLRIGLAVLAVAALLLALPLVVDGTTLGVYLGDGGRLLERLQRLPAIVAGIAGRALLQSDFGLCYWILLALLATMIYRRRLPEPALLAFLLMGLGLLVTPFLLSPEADLRYHLRSSADRLLLHWVGPVWLWIAAAGTAIADPAPPLRPAPAT